MRAVGRSRRAVAHAAFLCGPACPQAANYLNIKELLDLTCQTVAQMIKGKTPEEIRKTFGIKVGLRSFPPLQPGLVQRPAPARHHCLLMCCDVCNETWPEGDSWPISSCFVQFQPCNSHVSGVGPAPLLENPLRPEPPP